VKELKRTEEQLKDSIFDIYSKWRSESSPDRFMIHYPRLLEQIYIWCKDYSFKKDIDNMGEEIAVVVRRIMRKTLDKDGFFKYLFDSLKREKAGFYREYNENDTIKIPREQKRKLREVEDFIRLKESQLGRRLTADEEAQSIAKWFKKPEYIEIYNAKNVGSTSLPGNDGTSETDPLDDYISKTDMETIRNAVKSLLDKKQDRSRPCYRALFTLYCVKKGITVLDPILDQEIIDSFYKKEGKKPTQYEIYQKYHAGIDKKGAEAQAAANLHKFLDELKTCLKNQ